MSQMLDDDQMEMVAVTGWTIWESSNRWIPDRKEVSLVILLQNALDPG